MHASLLTLLLLAAPPGAVETCDRLVAAGAIEAAHKICEARPGLDLFGEALSAQRDGRLPDALAAAEQAAALNPEGVVEEALAQHLARAVRHRFKLSRTPRSARTPLPGLSWGWPALPALEDADVVRVQGAVERSQGRLRELNARRAEHDTVALQAVEVRLTRELQVLQRRHLGALEDAIAQDPRLPPVWWLHLAKAYATVDTITPDPTARAIKVLHKLRDTFPKAPAAGLAALELASYALLNGDERLATRLLKRGPDTPLSRRLTAAIHWHAGQTQAAQSALAALKDDAPLPSYALYADLAAQRGDAMAAAHAWTRIAERSLTLPLARRAQHRAAIAWSDAVHGGALPGGIPVAYRAQALLHLLSRGRLNAYGAALDAAFTDTPEVAELPWRDLMLVDAYRAAGRPLEANRRLARMAVNFSKTNGWTQAHPKLVEPVRAALRQRVDACLMPALELKRALDDELRSRLAPLVDARLALSAADLAQARALGIAGFIDRTSALLKGLSQTATSRGARIQALQLQLQLSVMAARRAGEAGAPVGAWLNGPTATTPPHPALRRVLAAQTALIAYLPPGSEAHDALRADEGSLRIALGTPSEVLDTLREIARRQPNNLIGLRAMLLVLRGDPTHRTANALRFSRRRPGPPERLTALRSLLKRAYAGQPRDRGAALIGQRLYAKAAEHLHAPANAGQDWARAAEATAWTLALRTDEALTAWRALIDEHPASTFTADAHAQLAELLELDGQRRAAANALLTLAKAEPERAPEALARAAVLRIAHPKRHRQLLQRLVDGWPNHRHAVAARARLKHLDAQRPTVATPAGPPPSPQAPCAKACDTPFFPPATLENKR